MDDDDDLNASKKNKKASDPDLIDQSFKCESKTKKVFVDDTRDQNVTKLEQVDMT